MSTPSFPKPGVRLPLVLAISLALASCSLLSPADLTPPAPMQLPAADDGSPDQGQLAQEQGGTESKAPRFSAAPKAKPKKTEGYSLAPAQIFPEDGPNDILVNINNLPISTFINEVYGNILGLDFQIDPDVSSKNDLITLRVSNARNKAYVYQLAREVLQSYGVTPVRSGDDYLRFVLGQDKATDEPPLLLTGAALPSVPESHRPIIYIRSLETIREVD